ncbi:MAG: TetR/AcrR family transcriptional regulator [Defluviitaleaceae bacterium]|nr:TetR/AcrR family transcriptional regulator [Defluviitaleaceae bacterium]MCL2274875.1 TetR/AcrR family transcriptional regulator [Defluviitaleaceae bacterium]
MPKVKDGYFEEKENFILNAAEKVCISKPLNSVTMKDVIVESGLSPGAVYASFSGFDEIAWALINRLKVSVNSENELSDTISDAKITPEEKIVALIRHFLNAIYSSVGNYGKIMYELSYRITFIKSRKKREQFKEYLLEEEMYGHIRSSILKIIDDNIQIGYFKPRVSKQSIYAMIVALMDGLIRDLILVKYYKIADTPMNITFEEEDLPNAIFKSILYLLNHGDG